MSLWSTMSAGMLNQPGRPLGATAANGAPLPLTGERMRVVLRGGLAMVSREQILRNAEPNSIEATLTFPVPVHATLHRLTAAIDGRVLNAKAMARGKARETYEQAIDDGKTAVLHEEAVRGIHLLSIAHIPPGAEIRVTHSWITAMSPRGKGKAWLRIPVTFGDVYGVSPFSDADDLFTAAGVMHTADVEIDAGGASVTATRLSLAAGRATARLDGPIDIHVTGITEGSVRGVAADGRGVSVLMEPDDGAGACIQAAILVDRSGSMDGPMNEGISRNGARPGRSLPGQSKHGAVVQGLTEAAQVLHADDRTELWQFDNECERSGTAGMTLAEAVGSLEGPRGGTDIGRAIDTVIRSSPAGDILLITDGLSHALDVQALVNTGRRFTVVLVGEDALEANVGRLAALSGGQIVLAANAADTGTAVRMAMASLRRSQSDFAIESWPLEQASLHAGGAVITARGGGAAGPGGEMAQAVGALAASIALPRLAGDQAALVAVRHGIVCHLTSLVLVDEAGEAQAGLPAQRRVPLMEADTLGAMRPRFSVASVVEAKNFSSKEPSFDDMLAAPLFLRSSAPASTLLPVDEAPAPLAVLAGIASRIDWTADPEALRRGDMSGLSAEIRRCILACAGRAEIVALAMPEGNAVAIVIALIARSAGMLNLAASRVARAVLKGRDPAAIARAAEAIGL